MRASIILAALLLAAPAHALVLCTMPDGKKYAGDHPPPNCKVTKGYEDTATSEASSTSSGSTSWVPSAAPPPSERSPSSKTKSAYQSGFDAGWIVGKSDAWRGQPRDGMKAARLGKIHGESSTDPDQFANGYHRGYNEGWHAAKNVGAAR